MPDSKKENLILIFSSTFIILFFIEVAFQFLIYKDVENKNFWHERYMLFEEGDVFQNVGNFFKYYPNKKILSETFYRTDGKFIKEYSYDIITNNFGLVQNTDIKKGIDSILFLGDSFVEGQGANAWINYYKGKYKGYQIINGGIIGTGPLQFKLMENHISNKFDVKKVIFFYIGDDIRRTIFNIPSQTIKCLKNSLSCRGDENLYGFPLRNTEPDRFLKKLAQYRDSQIEEKNFKYYRRTVRKKLLDLYVIKIPLNFLRRNFYSSKNEKIIKNFEVINDLHAKYKNNIYFIQIKQKNEILSYKSYESNYTEKYIKKITNNHFSCNFENNINNFHKIDVHPNLKGYRSLYNCTKKIMDENIFN